MTDERHLSARTEALFRRLVRREAAPALKKLMAMHRSEDIAAVMTHMTWDEQRRLYHAIDDRDHAAEILALLPEESVLRVTDDMTEEVVADLLDRMDPDDATDVVGLLSEDRRERILAEMEDSDVVDVKELLAWPPDTAGGIMSSAFFAMPDTATCGSAIRELQKVESELSYVHYVYVVDREQRLIGVTSLRALVVRPPNTPLSQIMVRKPITVRPEEDQEEVARYVARYDLMAIPVVNAQNQMLGIVTVDDVVDVIREEADEDMLRMAGMSESGEPGEFSLIQQLRLRAGWLLVTVAGGMVGSVIIQSFSGTLAHVAALAAFIPVIMGMGGNVGLQAATLAVRGLATGQVQLRGATQFVMREAQVGLAMGMLYGIILGTFGLVRNLEAPLIGLSVAFSALVSMSAAAMVGAGMPLLLARAGRDPAVATGPLVTLCIDLLGIVVYLNIATLLLG